MQKTKGFTLIELLVSISIIAILITFATIKYNTSIENTRVVNSVAQVKVVHDAIKTFYATTSVLPASCRLDCTAATDPFINSLGVAGWAGPYLSPEKGMYNLSHSWGGMIAFMSTVDVTGDGVADPIIVLDDDKPGTDANNNQGFLEDSALIKLDKALDDGNLTTGMAGGHGYLSSAPLGELIILIPSLY